MYIRMKANTIESWDQMKLISDKVPFAVKKEESLFYIEGNKKNRKYFELHRDNQTEMDKETFYYKLYGEGYEKILKVIGNKDVKVDFDQEGNIYTCYYQESLIHKFNEKGKEVRVYKDMGNFDTIYDFAIKDDSVWCVYPTSHVVIKYSLDDCKIQASVPEALGSISTVGNFSYPESISEHENMLYVADMGNKRVCRIDAATNKVGEYLNFEVPVFGFEVVGDMKILFLDNSSKMYVMK